jgi:O-antigen ligase
MIRASLVWLFVLAVAMFALRDWYKGLCGLILLTAVVQHPDMPKTLFGIQGFNAWNLCLLLVVGGWLIARRRENLTWDMPRHVSLLLLAYLFVILVGFVRLLVDRAAMGENESTASIYSDYLINTIKWTFPGLLLFDGARSRQRFALGLACSLGVYVLLAAQVIRWMPPSALTGGEDLADRALRVLSKEVGFHRVNLSMLLAGASWAVFAARGLLPSFSARMGALFVCAATVYAQALTGGRMGYVTWFVVGFVLCALRWRRYLLAIPVVVVAAVVFLPGAADRMMQGFDAEDKDTPAPAANLGDGSVNTYEVTSGRTVIWPYVIAKFGESPLVGHGRRAMTRTGVAAFLFKELRESFPHPHNAYLEWLLDNGWIGFLLVVPFYLVMMFHSVSLLRDSRSAVFVAAGGACLALILALLVASVGSQTFYPREGAVGMWCAFGLMLRAKVERERAQVEAIARPATSTAPAASGGTFSSRLRRPATAPSLDAFLWSDRA